MENRSQAVVLGGGVVETGVSVLLSESVLKTLSPLDALTCNAFAQVLGFSL
jgi:hypothetical protein